MGRIIFEDRASKFGLRLHGTYKEGEKIIHLCISIHHTIQECPVFYIEKEVAYPRNRKGETIVYAKNVYYSRDFEDIMRFISRNYGATNLRAFARKATYVLKYSEKEDKKKC